MKASKVFKILMWSATEYLAGYEFPVWCNGKWITAAQWKLTPFIVNGEKKK